MAAETSRSSGAADSYIGSLISLTSKLEIRYEGILYNINTEESSIGLRNVTSFGTEGRKKDGPQIPPIDKVFAYILFRGADIKDLQVKSSPPAQTSAPIHNDPAIIQYSRPPAVSTSVPSATSGITPDPAALSAQMGIPRSPFQGGLPLYSPAANLASWAPAPPNANSMPPMYWPGFYAPASGLHPHSQQQQLLRPPGLSITPMQQPMTYSGMIATSLPHSAQNPPEFLLPLLPPVSLPSSGGSYPSLNPSSLPTSVGPAQAAVLASEQSSSLMSNKAPVTSLSTTTPSANLPMVSPLTSSNLDLNSIVPSISSKGGARAVPGSTLPSQPLSQSVPTVGPSTSSHSETLVVPPLVTPGQILQPSTGPSSQLLTAVNKDSETAQPALPEVSSSAVTETQAPILPLPTLKDHKVNGAMPVHYGYRGRGRGRGNGISRPVTKFTEDFDFTAMNEKFKKDEVWGHLGKSKVFKEDAKDDDAYDNVEEDDSDASKLDSKQPVYVKDDFFDTLSCNALDRGGRHGRTKFSEQMKIDTETFGDFARHRGGGRGGRGPGRGGRGRGSYYGRGYGYVGRGRGQTLPSRTN